MTINTAVKESVKLLAKSNVENPELEVRWILESLLNMSTTEILVNSDSVIGESDYQKLRLSLERRASGEPLAYVLNEKEFYGYKFFVDSRVLIPRPETELIVDFCKESLMPNEDIQAMDMGSGSGCLAITLAKEFPHLNITAVDVSEDALEVVNMNREFHEVESRVSAMRADLNVADFADQFDEASLDLVVANPPYIDHQDLEVAEDVKKFEPHLALYADGQGLDCIKKWLAHSSYLLKTGGYLFFEIGANQKIDVLNILEQMNQFESYGCYQDLSDRDRVIYAKKR